MFRLDVHLDRALVLIHDDFRGKATIDHSLEVGVSGRLGNAAVLRTATGEIEKSEGQNGDDIDPVHVEPGHVHLRTITVVLYLIVFIHYCLFELFTLFVSV